MERAKILARQALERHRTDYQVAEGKGDQATLRSGHFFNLTEYPRQAFNGGTQINCVAAQTVSLAGDETEMNVMLCACADGQGTAVHLDHHYVPSDWLKNEFPKPSELIEIIGARAKTAFSDQGHGKSATIPD